MRLFVSYFVLLCCGSLASAQTPHSLPQLLQMVKEDRVQEQQLNAQRLAEFKARRDQQAALLAQAQAELSAQQAQNAQLRQQFTDNNQRFLQTQTQLEQQSADLQSLFQHFRQFVTDVQPRLTHSLIAAQNPQRAKLLQNLLDSPDTLSLEHFKQLWHMLLEDMVASSQISRFSTAIITSEGQEQQRQVLRTGSFTAVSEGAFLRYLPDTGKLIVSAQQPATRWQTSAATQQQAHTGLTPGVIDPSQGDLLNELDQAPNWQERLQQGGVIGYLILVLGALGLLLVLERFSVLWWMYRRVQRQLQQPEKPGKNPLWRVFAVYLEQPGRDIETLELKLDEAILREIPPLRRGLSSIGVLATVAPLLGLLGTVTGIIHTFQVITLQGTGDPKLLSGGISEALVTTEFGLIVAIPLLLSHSWLRGMSNSLIQILDEQSAALIARQAEALHSPVHPT